ncbi:Tn3 family transposase [Nonomuraea sp. NPDC001831]|uniref:Tn3 family transposase n=1 Tax=Nonomuraea sp. NPDC001831 TaxID=3364340 RepID=UPI003694F3EA
MPEFPFSMGSLGLALNAVVWWNNLHLDAAVSTCASRASRSPMRCARLSPIQYDHIDFLGRYAFFRAEATGGLRPFHDGAQEADDPSL